MTPNLSALSIADVLEPSAIDLLIAARFPAEWARANDPTLPKRSKARNKVRSLYHATVALETFKAQFPLARCANCNNATVNPSVGIVGTACDLGSDFYGYAMIDEPSAHVCARWLPSASLAREQSASGDGL